MSVPNIGELLLNFKFAEMPTPYSPARLQSDLSAGVASIVAGVGSDYRLLVDTVGARIVASHKDAVFKGTAVPGSVKPALGITSAGIAMGYNRASDGVWVDSIAIDASGNASFSGSINATSGNFTGTITAGSVITNTVTVSGTGYTLGSIAASAVNGDAAYSALSGKLDKNASYVLGAASEFKTSGYDAGNGLNFTNNGIVAKNAGTTTFSIASNGEAVFRGNLSTTIGSVTAYGMSSETGANGCVVGWNISHAGAGVVGYVDSASSAPLNSAAIMGSTNKTGIGGVSGIGDVYGVRGSTSNAAGYGVLARNTGASGVALRCEGRLSLTDSTGLNADTLDGSHASAFAAASHNHSGVYLGISSTAANSSALNGYADTSFARSYSGATLGAPTGTAYTGYFMIAGVAVKIPLYI